MTSSDEVPLIDMVAEEYLERVRRGEAPSVDDYVARHPQLEDEIRDLLPTLRFLEDFKPSSDDKARPAEAATESEPSRAPLEQIGDYRILKEIGRGGMGVVYEAEQLSLGRHVALKVLPRRAAQDDVASERFQREARATAQLQHPNIVPIIDIGNDGESSYYAMQFVRGRSLAEIQDEVRRLRAESSVAVPHRSTWSDDEGDRIDTSSIGGRQYWRSVARIGVQVSRALAYAHDRDVIHRDIKPSNLLLDDEGTVWVTDFGLAKTVDDGLTMTGDVVGTLRFMSPERFKGQCDARADVFSLGATLYELLVLEPAFQSPDRLHLIERITKEEPRSLRSVDPSVPADLETIVLKALEKDPRRRYQTAAAVGQDLTRFLAHQPIRARRTSALGRALRWSARNRALAITATCLVAILVAVVVGSIAIAVQMRRLADTATEARDVTQRQLYRSLLQGAVDAVHDGRLNHARQVLDETPTQLRGWEWRHVRSRLDRSVGSPIAPSTRLTQLDYSRDGTLALLRLLHIDNRLSFRVVRTSDWSTVMTTPPETGTSTASLAPDGSTLITTGAETQVWRVGDGEVVRRDGGAGKYWVAIDGDRYLRAESSVLEMRSIASGEVMGKVSGPPWCAAVSPDLGRVVVGFDSSIGWFDGDRLAASQEPIELPGCGALTGCSFSKDGRMVAFTSGGGVVYLLEFRAGKLHKKHELTGYLGYPTHTVFSNDGGFVAVGTTIGRVYAWDTETGNRTHEFSGHRTNVEWLAAEPQTGVLISCDKDGGHRGWSFEPGSFEELRGHQSYVYPVAFSQDATQLVSGGWDGYQNKPGSLRFWDVRSGDHVTARMGPGEFVFSLACLSDNRVVCAVQQRSLVPGAVVYDSLTGDKLLSFERHGADNVAAVVAHPDGLRVLTVGSYQRAILWHVDDGRVEHEWNTVADGSGGYAAAFTPDGTRLALTSDRQSIRILDVATGDELGRWIAHDSYVRDLAFTPDGKALVSCSDDGTVCVWQLDGTLRRRMTGHGIDVMCVAVSPDGKRIASGGRDGALLLWDAQHLDLVARLSGHRDYIYEVVWSPDGQRLVTTSGDGTVRMWSEHTLAQQVHERAARGSLVARLLPLVRAELDRGLTAVDVMRTWSESGEYTTRELAVVRQLLMAESQR